MKILKAKRLITRLRLVDMLMKMDPDNRIFCNKSLKKRGGGLVGVPSYGSERIRALFKDVFLENLIHNELYIITCIM